MFDLGGNRSVGIIVLLVLVLAAGLVGSINLQSSPQSGSPTPTPRGLAQGPTAIGTPGENTLHMGNFTPPPSPTSMATPTPTTEVQLPTATPTTPIVSTPSPTLPASFPSPTGINFANMCLEDSCQAETNNCYCEGMSVEVCKNVSCTSGYNSCGGCLICPPGSYYLTCEHKPIVYLYPEKEMQVSVKISSIGQVVKSDPQYTVNGWQNIAAYPDGHFMYQGNTYHELYYETALPPLPSPTAGIVLDTNTIAISLPPYLTQLGLNSFEQKEFLDYWTPLVKGLKTSYVQFSVLPQNEKEKIDHLDITPEPETRIEFLVDFKSVSSPLQSSLYVLPTLNKERLGFTEVEWGGSIE